MPRLFDKAHMSAVIRKYNPYKYGLLLSSLYFNGGQNKTEFLTKRNPARLMLVRFDDEYSYAAKKQTDLESLCGGRQFLIHSNEGLTPMVKSFIANRFSEPSKYEI